MKLKYHGKIEENIDHRVRANRAQDLPYSRPKSASFPDLAQLYEVEPRILVQAVKRNLDRFPDDFIFQLTDEEAQILKSQIVISSWGGSRANPYAFTEQGVAMLSSVLRSKRAVQLISRSCEHLSGFGRCWQDTKI